MPTSDSTATTRSTASLVAGPLLTALVACLAVVTSDLHAQPGRNQPAQTTTPNRGGTAVVELSNRPVIRESLGLRLYLPLGAEAQTYEFGGRSSLTVMLPGDLGVINVQDSAASEQSTLTTLTDGIIRNRLGLNPSRPIPGPGERVSRGAVISRAPNLSISQTNGPTQMAERAYLAVQDSPTSAAVMGYTVIKPSATRVLTFELITDPARFERARQMYELTVASAVIEDPSDIAERRRLGVETGIRWLQDIDQQKLTQAVQAIGEDWRYERLYRPNIAGGGDDAAEEIAYRRINARVGRRSDVNPSSTGGARALDNQRGYVVRIQSRTLHQGLVIDSAAVFFLSLDRSEESWSVEMAVRDQQTGQVQRSSEIGVRYDDDLPVSTRVGDAPAETSKPQLHGPGYVSRVESFLLPYLLIQTGLPAEYRFYSFQSQSGQIQMRSDVLDRQAESELGAWKLTSRLSQDVEPQTSLLGPDGAMLLTTLDDGSRWQPIELSRLGRLWRAKRLPMT